MSAFTRTQYTNFPVCPECGELNEDWWDGLTFHVVDGSEWTRTCECGQKMKVTASVDIEFCTEAL